MYTKDHSDKYNCSYCDMFIGSKENAKQHERIVHKATSESVECKCKKCLVIN